MMNESCRDWMMSRESDTMEAPVKDQPTTRLIPFMGSHSTLVNAILLKVVPLYYSGL